MYVLMKKVLFLIVLSMMAICVNAQVWVGGSIGINVLDPVTYGKSSAITSVTFSPEVGYSFNEKWGIALAINESCMFYENESANSIQVEPYARFTFAKSGIASFFVDGGFGVGSTEIGSDGSIYDEPYTKLYVGLRPGVKIDLSEKIGLVAKLGFLGYEYVEKTYTAFGLSVNNNSLSFGMYWNF